MTRLKGVIAAAATPLAADGRIDLEKLVRHCSRLLALGCDGINLLGTTGEATSFSVEQRVEAMACVAGSGLPMDRFMVGTGAAALGDAVRLTTQARHLGFAGALVLPPFYYKGIDATGLVNYFNELIGAVGRQGLRIYLYHFPQNSGVPYTPEAVDRLLGEYPDVFLGLKDSSGDLAYSVALARRHPGFDVFPSTEGALGDAARDSFAGCISATVNVTVPLVAGAYHRPDQSLSAAAARLAPAMAIRTVLGRFPLVAAVKWALAVLLDDPHWARVVPPLRVLSSNERAALESMLDSVEFRGLKATFAHAGASASAGQLRTH